MFNIEGFPYNTSPFAECPKKQQISTTSKDNLTDTLSCLHVGGFNISLGPYIRCIECNLEGSFFIPPSRNTTKNDYMDLHTAQSMGCPAMTGVVDYLANFLGKPHPDLEAVGHKGSVCPFTPKVLENETVYFGQEIVDTADLNEQERIKQKLIDFHLPEFFETVETRISLDKLKTACTLILVRGPKDATQCDYFVSQTQKLAQPDFVQAGLLLSELHPFSPVPSVRSDTFFPSRPPVPIFFIRRIIPNDIPYLLRRDRYDETTYNKIAAALEKQFGNDVIIQQMERLGKKL